MLHLAILWVLKPRFGYVDILLAIIFWQFGYYVIGWWAVLPWFISIGVLAIFEERYWKVDLK